MSPERTMPEAQAVLPWTLEARGICKTYQRRAPGHRSRIEALRNVNLSLKPGETLSIVGKSGCGKSTLARCLVLLEEPDAGIVRLEGIDLLRLKKAELQEVRWRMQLVFQHSTTALNPLYSAADAISEPLQIRRNGTRAHRREQALHWMNLVGLPTAWSSRSCSEFSGGERQRIALARALILQPRVLILDEPLAGLDVSTQAYIVDLLRGFQETLSFSLVFISHDLRMAAQLGDRLAVMESGQIIESGNPSEVLETTQSAATRELVAAMPASMRMLCQQVDL